MFYDYALLVVLLGILSYLIWKTFGFVIKFRALCDVCRKLPGHPTHWLKGNLDQVHDSVSYLKYAEDLVKEKGARCFRLWAGPFPTFGVCHPETAKIILRSASPKPIKDPNDGYRMLLPWLGDGLLMSEGKKWERSRRLITPAFHFEILRQYVPEYNIVADTLLEKMTSYAKSGYPVEVSTLVSRATLDTMLRCALSYQGNVQADGTDEHPYVRAVRELSRLLFKRLTTPLHFSDVLYSLSSDGKMNRQLCNFVHNFTKSIIQARKVALAENPDSKKKGKLDFLDILLTARDESGVGLTDQEIQDEVDTFTFEGHDTTASAISWAIYALGRYPEEQDKVFKEVESVVGDKSVVEWDDLGKLKYLSRFLKEVLRFYSPVPIIARRLTEPRVIDGVEFPAQRRIDINLYCLHHHPDVWPDHMEFRPERFELESTVDKDPYGFVPFSAGPRNCIGQNFAMNEQKVLISKILQRFIVSIHPADNEPVFLPDVVMRSRDGINVYLESRQ